MNTDHHFQIPPVAEHPTPVRSFWQRIGFGSLSISLMLHMVLLAIGVIWVLQVIPPAPEKVVDFMPVSGGGGSPAAESKVNQQRVQMAQPDLSRIAAIDSISNITLPDPVDMTPITSLGSLSTGGLSKGIGGPGSGGGKGDGSGPGVGAGTFPGMSNGIGTKNPFGMLTLDKNALVGTFYDLKQTSDRKPTEMTDDEMRKEVADIVKRGFREKEFEKFFKAPRTLFQSKLLIPVMSADSAPAAFEVEKEVQPKRWVVVYRGAVQAPKSGNFRFVGAGDDLLVVRFNNRPVFDYGYTIASTGDHIYRRFEELNGTRDNPELEKAIRRSSPMRLPIKFYPYSTTPRQNNDIGGMAVGPEFEVRAGQVYPVEILISEIPGGFFSTALLIEETGVNYAKDSTGSPILPLFRLDFSLPDPEMKGEAPPYDPSGPVWKAAAIGAARDL